MIFQITDDYLDLFGTDQDLNKKMGQDLITGTVTLPIIYLYELLKSTIVPRIRFRFTRNFNPTFES